MDKVKISILKLKLHYQYKDFSVVLQIPLTSLPPPLRAGRGAATHPAAGSGHGEIVLCTYTGIDI